MRLTEIFKNILNKFIRRNPKKEPEGIQIATEPIAEPEEVQKTVQSDYDRQQKLIRRYRAYAFHHKKKRLRKKYMKKLLEASPIDNYFFLSEKEGVRLSLWQKNVSNWMKTTGEEYMPKKDLLHGTTGSHKSDHPDSKIEGGVR
nr:MAG: hypothetical protein [Bacteriophage sp.]